MIKKYLDFLNEKSSGQIFNPKRGEYEVINATDYPELSEEFFDLISTAYSYIGGHGKIDTPDDVFKDPDWNYWAGVDIHGTNDYDIVFIGNKTNYGVKYTCMGHDGELDSKRKMTQELADKLESYGYYAEVSDKIGDILTIKYKVPIIDDEEYVKKILNKDIDWIGTILGKQGHGWYKRKINGILKTKMLVGRPKKDE